jgi:hypothetical protein
MINFARGQTCCWAFPSRRVVREENGKQKPVAVVSDSDLVYHLMKEVE